MLALVIREGLRMLSSTIGDATPEFLDYAQSHHHDHQDHEQCKESVRSFTFNERYPQDASSDIQYDVQSNDEKKEWIIKKRMCSFIRRTKTSSIYDRRIRKRTDVPI